jgi:ATP-dependent exoDNAse (exonuclease V) beta subunit
MDTRFGGLRDDAARRTALSVHDRSLLVEAGAGSGKTAVMAGRIALMLAEGKEPRSIAAVTFTELAASELLVRVRDFVTEILDGRIPPEMRVALPTGLSSAQTENLKTASATIDEITCSTIHGFCQRLIKPYPVEADIDPGATIIDRVESDLIFREISEVWLREQLAGETASLISAMVLQDAHATVGLIHKILNHLRTRRTITAPATAPHAPLLDAFRRAVAAFDGFVKATPAREPETIASVDCFKSMVEALTFALAGEDPASLIRLLLIKAHDDICTKSGSFSAYRKKGKWCDAAKRARLPRGDADRLNDAAMAHHAACCATWTAILEAVAGRVLGELIREIRPVVGRFQDYKRGIGNLDFDDLIFAARHLLKTYPEVRTALASRYAHVLVDEFQDTDPLQIEILWRLCGEPQEHSSPDKWSDYAIRPGALFLVGDPKQAIYRFRGADVAAYVSARDAFGGLDGDNVLPISTNFRSRAPILTYVNSCFEATLSSPGQPGFTKLDPFHEEAEGAKCVVALDVMIESETGKATAEQRRDAEAEAVAEMCARLISGETIIDRKTGESRPCRPGDIALLAPSGSDLWRYETALERYRIPVATQAGKGFFQRQEIQDVIAITRVLADGRDTLALGALLRGPLVGLTEEQLLDVVWALPRPEGKEDELPRLTLSVPPESIQNPLARDVIEKLQSLRRRANSTTPHEIVSQAIDTLRVRPILLARHRGQAERALSNADLYLSFTRAYALRGLRAFAEAMTTYWKDEERAVEGRPDAQEESVALYTIHASKGLEWPIVVPINTMTTIVHKETTVTNRVTEEFFLSGFRSQASRPRRRARERKSGTPTRASEAVVCRRDPRAGDARSAPPEPAGGRPDVGGHRRSRARGAASAGPVPPFC